MTPDRLTFSALLFALCLLGLGCNAPLAVAQQPSRQIDLQGHRGARGLAPENTLASFATALSLGVTTLELDIGITRDGVLVLSHDPTLNPDITRNPDGKFLDARGPAISSLTFEELQKFDVGTLKPGTGYAQQFPYQKASPGTRIPRLTDLFDLVKRSGNTQVRFAIETKLSPAAPNETVSPEVFARAVISAIKDAGVEKRSSVLSFDWRTLQVVQKEAPEIPTVYLTIERRNTNNTTNPAWTAGHLIRNYGSVPKMVKAAGGHTWSSDWEALNKPLVQEAQALGLTVLAWTVNDPRQMETMLDMGVDGLVTDRPDLARDVLQKRGLSVPDPTPISHQP
ncbi:glycerophosphodiester phosphodiesterase [Variovorax sp. J22R133]|uniref:glycerophosphodiester phosphodiesterase n=1 Tax=Variovorax brevis TaxID=3053503 RepID=UPI0025759CE7|nr:glycerophosphodiester phosphodiesterase [Variovorax sp. J22R133]MDM0117733.1 glycerophosphodiester phosphodiesterase [Variovorax sp. J22R133]